MSFEKISQNHPARGLRNWLIYDIGDRWNWALEAPGYYVTARKLDP